MLQTDDKLTIVSNSGTPSLTDTNAQPSVQKGDGDSRVKNMGPLTETESSALNERNIDAVIHAKLSSGDELSVTTRIHEFLNNPNILPHLPLITEIQISSTVHNNNEIQTYKEDLQKFLICLYQYRMLLSALKTVTFGAPPQPYIHVKECPKPEKVTFQGILFSVNP